MAGGQSCFVAARLDTTETRSRKPTKPQGCVVLCRGKSTMNILYVSVHQILEYDEIRILHGLGHSVVPLGTCFRFVPSENFRPALSFTQKEFDLREKFDTSGCRYSYNAPVTDHALTAEFVDQFDAILV